MKRLRKPIEIVAMFNKGHPLTVRQLADHCDREPDDVRKTVKLLQEYDLIRFAGWGEREPSAKNYGPLPAKWVWA